MLFIRSHKKTTMHSILGLSIWIIFLLSPVIATTDRREELLRNYSRFVLPPERTVSVTINLALYELIDLDVAGESVHCLFWQRNTWNDKRLAWTLDTADPGLLKVSSKSLVFLVDAEFVFLVKSTILLQWQVVFSSVTQKRSLLCIF